MLRRRFDWKKIAADACGECAAVGRTAHPLRLSVAVDQGGEHILLLVLMCVPQFVFRAVP